MGECKDLGGSDGRERDGEGGSDGEGEITHLDFPPFLLFPPLFFPVFVPLITALGCAGSLDSGLAWCFFWCLLAWLPTFNRPRLWTGVWARTWPWREALSLACVQGGMVALSRVVVVVVGGGCGMAVVVGRKKDVMWQCVSHSCHVWNVTGRGPQRWVI